MITTFLLWLTASLALALVATLLHNAITCKLALLKYKKDYPTLPFFTELGWFGNHLLPLSMDQNVTRMHDAHLKFGDVVCGMVNTTRAVSICDPVLLKKIVVDNASINFNRYSLPIPMNEYDTDTIMTCRDDQWKRIRTTFAAAMK